MAELINTKVMSYSRAFDKIKEHYRTQLPNLENMKWNSLRYYMIKREIIDRPNSLKSINKAISKSGFALSRKERIIEDVMKEFYSNPEHLVSLLTKPENLNKIIEEIVKNEKYVEILAKNIFKYLKNK